MFIPTRKEPRRSRLARPGTTEGILLAWRDRQHGTWDEQPLAIISSRFEQCTRRTLTCCKQASSTIPCIQKLSMALPNLPAQCLTLTVTGVFMHVCTRVWRPGTLWGRKASARPFYRLVSIHVLSSRDQRHYYQEAGV